LTPYIEMAVPLDISSSELLVAARTLPADVIKSVDLLNHWSSHYFRLAMTPGEVTLHTKAQLRNEHYIGMLMSRLFE